MEVKYAGQQKSALLDTGSDVSIAGEDVARKYGWIVHEHPTKTVKMANDEEMIIDGAAKVPLQVGERNIHSEILITPDLNGLIIGIYWVEKQGQFVWNFRDGKIKFEDGEWLELQHEEASQRVRKVYICEDTLILALGNAEVNVRVTHESPDDKPYIGLIEQKAVSSLKDIYCTCSLLPARFSDIRISMINMEDKNQLIPKGAELGVLHEAEVLEIPEGLELEREEDEMESEDEEAPKISRVRTHQGSSSRGRRKKHPMADWNKEKRNRLRWVGAQYHKTMIDLGVFADNILVQAKPNEDGQINWCTDYRSCPLSNSTSEVPKVFHLTRPPESEEDSVDEDDDVYEILDEVEMDDGLTSASEAMDMLDLDEVLLLEGPVEESDENADGLSRRPPPDDVTPEEVRASRKEKKNTDSFVLVGENLPLLQQQDPELGHLVNLHLRSTVAPTNEELQVESELTKKCVLKWECLSILDGLVYLRDTAMKKGEPLFFDYCFLDLKLIMLFAFATLV